MRRLQAQTTDAQIIKDPQQVQVVLERVGALQREQQSHTAIFADRAEILQAAAQTHAVGQVIQLFHYMADLSQGFAQAHFRQEIVFDENSGYDQVETALPEAIQILGGNHIFAAAVPLVGNIPGQVEVRVDDEGLLVKVGDFPGQFAVHAKFSSCGLCCTSILCHRNM